MSSAQILYIPDPLYKDQSAEGQEAAVLPPKHYAAMQRHHSWENKRITKQREVGVHAEKTLRAHRYLFPSC